MIYLPVAVIGVVLAAIAYFMNRGRATVFTAATLMEIVIMAVIGVITKEQQAFVHQ
jgi:peptidoglycan/LPS O-acetylase OafA/YrhL